MKVVTSPFRLSLLGVVLVGLSTVLIDPIAAQYAAVHRVAEGLVEFGPGFSGGAAVFWTLLIVFPVSGIVSAFIYYIMIGAGLAFAEPDGQIEIDLSDLTLVVTERSDPRVDYDEKLRAALLPTYFIALVFGYISEFVTTLFVWFIVSLFLAVILALLVSLSIGSTKPAPSAAGGSSASTTLLPSNVGTGVTNIFTEESGCPECEAELSDYSDPEYCPSCGFQLDGK